jgi:LemA protein
MKKCCRIWLIIVVVIIAVLCVSSVSMYNGLVKADKGTAEAKAQVETVCQRRLDLIPNLVETVKGYAGHEQATLVAVTAARSRAQGVLDEVKGQELLSKEQMLKLAASESKLATVMKRLFALAENYPDLRASTNFLTLQDQLEGTENRISVARQRYNSAIRFYNTNVAMFPKNIVASVFGFEENDNYFEAAEGAKEVVEVRF